MESEHVTRSSAFWDALAPHHSAIENSYLDLRSLRRILPEVRQPVLVVGAGQGLLLEELKKKGFQSDGVDLSPVMVRYASLRRGLTLVEADARAMPFGEGAYSTIIYATGVIDFIADEQDIRPILDEGKRIAGPSGKIFVAFYRLSPALEEFATRVGLLRNNLLANREGLESYLLGPVQMMKCVAQKAGVGRLAAALLVLRMSVLATMQEKTITFRMQRMFRKIDARPLIEAAPEKQPYRNEAEIRNLFKRLAVPMKQLEAFSSCYMVEI